MDEVKAPDRSEAIAKVEAAADVLIAPPAETSAAPAAAGPTAPDSAATLHIVPEPLQPEGAKAETAAAAEAAPQPGPSAAAGGSRMLVRYRRPSRLTPLAAAVAAAAVIGAVTGALATVAAHVALAPSDDATTDARATRDAVARLNGDLAGLKQSLDASAKAASGQMAKLAERLDRNEKAQAEPNARLNKIAEAVERLNRGPTPAAPAAALPQTAEITGSIPSPRPSPLKEMSRSAVIPGWVLRSVYDGTAFIQSQAGMIEVEVGDPLPGGGHVQSIRRQDGRWMVVTTRGIILSAR